MNRVLRPDEFYEEVQSGDFVQLNFGDGTHETAKVEGVMLLAGAVSVVTTSGRRLSLDARATARILERRRGY